MFVEILIQSWTALRRNPTRTLLTMLGIVWGIAAVTLLMAYGASFRGVLLRSFEAFGKSAIIASAGQTSEQAGGERAGRRIRFEQADVDAIKRDASLVKHSCLESIRNFPMQPVCRPGPLALRPRAPSAAGRKQARTRSRCCGSTDRWRTRDTPV